jgi:hypothetical protein
MVETTCRQAIEDICSPLGIGEIGLLCGGAGVECLMGEATLYKACALGTRCVRLIRILSGEVFGDPYCVRRSP